jgi:hypothetical protein
LCIVALPFANVVGRSEYAPTEELVLLVFATRKRAIQRGKIVSSKAQKEYDWPTTSGSSISAAPDA